MRKPIQDEFTHLPVSRQRKYQLRMQRDGRCTECGAPSAGASRCLKHLVLARERQRAKFALRDRYYNTLSYRLEAEAKKKAALKRKQKARRAAAAKTAGKSAKATARKGR